MELLEQLESIFERKRGKKAGAGRHKDRYGSKPASGSQVSTGFKRARQGLTELMATLARGENSDALHRVSGLNRELHEILRDMDLDEEVEIEPEIEDVA